MDSYIFALVDHAMHAGIIQQEDKVWAVNSILEVMQLDEIDVAAPAQGQLHEILEALTEDAVQRGICDDNQVARDLFDTKLMGVLTPMPHEVRGKFRELYAQSPKAATDWYYALSQDTNYIRRDRIAKDEKWKYDSE